MAEETGYMVKETIDLLINGVFNTIELCLGDISTLENHDNIDVLLISAKPDAYANWPGSVIQALQENLNLSVADLAANKAADMRGTHKCWWSHPLRQENDVPFDRLMCYESGAGISRSSQFTDVKILFSSLEEIFLKQDFTVATSLLNTGRQRENEVVMLEAIVEAAIAVMDNGLNLRRVKIFVNDEHKPWYLLGAAVRKRNPTNIYTKFAELKSVYERHYNFE